jgi:protein-S-isoprenylcysteine O-methyltransferase Ste14
MEGAGPGFGGAWPLTIIMVVVVTWFVFKFLVPKGYKEWGNVGLVQAFVIALYAEMYGFPLTIYLLTSFFGRDIPLIHMSGHLWSYLFGWGAGMAIVEMLVGYFFIFTGLSFIVRGWRLVYAARKDERLVTGGIYRFMRHPQYTGIYLAVFGQLIHWPTIPTLSCCSRLSYGPITALQEKRKQR